MAPLLEIENLHVVFDSEKGIIKAVNGVSLKVEPGATLGIVGESGSGKSVTCHSILRLHPPNGRIVQGVIRFGGVDLLLLDNARLNTYRGREIAMIFQDPMSALNPVHTVGGQIAESLKLHRRLNHKAAWAEAISLLETVGIPDAGQRSKEYPHQLSGGMNQRVMIAMALSCRPKLLIADEPTTALDVTIQAQILELMREIQRGYGMSIILITHDLGVVAEMANHVVVMYSGHIAEQAPVANIFDRPSHPYTLGLLDSLPRIDSDMDRLKLIDGAVPSPFELPPGCHFAPRCRFASGKCQSPPRLQPIHRAHEVACFHPQRMAS